MSETANFYRIEMMVETTNSELIDEATTRMFDAFCTHKDADDCYEQGCPHWIATSGPVFVDEEGEIHER